MVEGACWWCWVDPEGWVGNPGWVQKGQGVGLGGISQRSQEALEGELKGKWRVECPSWGSVKVRWHVSEFVGQERISKYISTK